MAILALIQSMMKRMTNVFAYVSRSLYRKMLLASFATITITVTTLGLYSYAHTSSDIKQREIQNMEMFSSQSAANLETQMANIRSTAWNYFSDPRFQSFVQTLGSDPAAYGEFSGSFSQFVTDHAAVEFIVVTQLGGNRLIKGNLNNTDVPDFEDLKEVAIANDGRGVWVPSIAFDSRTGQEASTLTFVQAVKKISALSKFPIIGVLMIQLSYEHLNQWLAALGETEGVDFLLADSKTETIRISADLSLLGKPLERHRGSDMLYVSQPLANTSWVLVGIVDVRTLLKKVNGLARDTIFIGLACLMGAMLLASVLSSRILTPLKELKKGILAVEKGDYDITLPIRSKDETGYIIHRFNHMAEEIKALILKVYETDLVRKEAEIKSLQSQINPHFLYNTLGIIDSLATLHEDDRISLISRSLAKMFRYNIGADRMSTMQMELRQIELYLYIQQQRYGNRFKYAIEVEEALYGIPIPKLLFQPLVENCFVHAFDGMSAQSELRIRGWSRSDRQIYVSIWNNGPPIEAARLAELNALLGKDIQQRRDSNPPSSIGLMNVQHRIKLLYGHDYGLTITSEREQGTEVVIVLRKLGEEERPDEGTPY
ncbi:two-component system, sensor histidine kinase YesM [Cohnella sp. OV330]|uniref:sensor histidine kinase n=1 Tax=Cohnella sp. OV330 TaxID=1855288 RepID=UPI0008EC485C|nr:histidine kinase [Cohnella sp. OV330]SFB58076.1 two-component system, sensor histidine kinase YesM [Cohnella sp. OV330]